MGERSEEQQRLRLLRALRLAVAAGILTLAIGAVAAGQLQDDGPLLPLLLAAALVARFTAWLRPALVSTWFAVPALVAAAGALAVQAGPLSVAQLLLVIAVADAGLTLGGSVGASLGLAAGVVVPLVAGTAIDPWVAATAALVGLALGLVRIPPPVSDRASLEAVATTLDELLRLAELLPAGLDAWSVASAVRGQLEIAAGGTPAHLVLVRDGVLLGVGEPWGRRPLGLVEEIEDLGRGRGWWTVDRADLPIDLARGLTGERWALRLLSREQEAQAIVLVAAPLSRDQRVMLDPLVDSATVAMANTGRFERLQRVARDAARVRVAHDLHDGVAQQLTHVRFELELLELAGTADADALARLRGVADSALSEVRRTVDELRADRPLVERLRTHVQQVQTFAHADVRLQVRGEAEVSPDVADDVVRVTQEAISNALRHARADVVSVDLTLQPGLLELAITDDGGGIPPAVLGSGPTGRRRGGGVGLEAMRGRAVRLGGDLQLFTQEGWGTRVSLAVPLTGNRRWVPHVPDAQVGVSTTPEDSR